MGTANFNRVMNAIKKAGLEVKQSEHRFTVVGPYYYGSFFKQDDNAVCLSTCKNGDQSDATVDYFPQTYHNTIKSFIKWVKFDGNWNNL